MSNPQGRRNLVTRDNCFKLLEVLVSIVTLATALTGVIGYIRAGSEREKQKHYQAWQVIIAAVGQEAEMGRKAAIEDLWSDKVNLSDLDIHKARIQKLDLSPHCSSLRSSLRSSRQRCLYVDLNNANLRTVDLSKSKLQGVNLSEANLQDADLSIAELQGASFANANLQRAKFVQAKLQGAWFEDKPNLQGADFYKAELHNTIFLNTDLRNTKRLVQGQLVGNKRPFLCNSPVPENFASINRDRDCKELPQVLMKKWPKQFPNLKKAQDHVRLQKLEKWEEEE